MKKSMSVVIAAMLLLVIGCASIIHGGMQDINVNTIPAEAKVTVYDCYDREVWSGTAPCTIPLERGDGYLQKARYRIEVAKEGYDPKSVYITSSIDAGWYLVGNFFLGGIIGWLIVDPASGAMWKLKPKEVNTHMDQDTAATSSDRIKVVLRSSFSDEAFQQLDPVRIR